nr:hypothetical protein [Bacteroides sp.]
MTNDSSRLPQALMRARAAWDSCSSLRTTRRRMKRFTYGRQWDDVVVTVDGRTMTMGEHSVYSGCQPVTNNLIRQIVKNVVGRFRGLHMDRTPSQLDELDARTLEEFLISGCAIQRVSRHALPGAESPRVDMVSPARFFVNPFRDPRGHDIETIGMLHDWSLEETVVRMGDNDPAREKAVRALYGSAADDNSFILRDIGAETGESFVAPTDAGHCRVIEVWTRNFGVALACHDPETGRVTMEQAGSADALARINAEREAQGRLPLSIHRRRTLTWTGRWYSPAGRLLLEREATAHPFVVRFYPLIDGEIHPFIEDVIDRQIQVNRTLTLIDRIISVSAKEVLLMPVESMVIDESDWTIQDYLKSWATPGAIIPYRSSGGTPSVVSTEGLNTGLSNLLSVELQLMEQVSGVTSALQGMKPASGTTASLYTAQAENASQALNDIFATFATFRAARDELLRA